VNQSAMFINICTMRSTNIELITLFINLYAYRFDLQPHTRYLQLIDLVITISCSRSDSRWLQQLC